MMEKLIDFNNLNINELSSFLERFNIGENRIKSFLKDKRIVKIDDNFFLIKKDSKMEPNVKFVGNPLFLKLKKFVPSYFLLDFLQSNGNVLVEKSYNRALKFTYGKNLDLREESNEVISGDLKNKNIHYSNDNTLFIFSYLEKKINKKLILGICEIKNNKIINLFNVGDYLHEN